MLVAPESSPRGPWVAKNIRTSEAAPVKSGDRQPVQQTLVVSQRQCLRLVVYLPVQFPLPPTRGTTACPSIVAHITKTDACSRCVLPVRSYPRSLVARPFLFLPFFTEVPRRRDLRSSGVHAGFFHI
jgi:hypothetical protein